eukprot:gene8618-9497_t
MPKLYYTPTSCGAASFISAYVAGVKLETEEVDLATHKTASGVDFYTINPKGNVPALVLDNGVVLNENAATLLYIADQAPGKVAPLEGTPERYELTVALSYIASEYHATIGGLFAPASDEVNTYLKEKLAKKLTYLDTTLVGKKSFLVGNSFTVADAYLYVALGWTAYLGISLDPYPNLKVYLESIGKIEAVQAAQALIATKPIELIPINTGTGNHAGCQCVIA